ncbi:MAG TPA: hypothetical protein VFN61_00290 [Acidimicrobiales bacterium]|nr:hypothetical protein [Acidimicrobiales bacterium]
MLQLLQTRSLSGTILFSALALFAFVVMQFPMLGFICLGDAVFFGLIYYHYRRSQGYNRMPVALREDDDDQAPNGAASRGSDRMFF